MAGRKLSRRRDAIDPETGERRWPEWHDDTLYALDRLNGQLVRRYLLLVVALLVVGYFALRATVNQGDAARRAQAAVVAIQRGRYLSFYDSCRETDRRHGKTVKRLRHLAATTPRMPGVSRAEGRRQIAATILLIDALEPKVTDCKAFARRRAALP